MKAESLNFDQSVYATRTDTYNARDQITRIFVQQGTSGTGQETLMTFDGHGRLKTRHTPIEESQTFNSYDYYGDDTVQKVTDPRLATSTYIYNARHLVTGITYCKPTGCASAPQGPNEINLIPNTPPAGFAYDSAGNRISMTDAEGSVDYHYDTWSRLEWEERTFTALPGSYRLSYEYNLAGALKKLTDPFGSVSYSFNSAGQVTAVTATGFGQHQLESTMQYRAWGGLKQALYGGSNLNVGYNGRMLLSSFALTFAGNPSYSSSEFQYYSDGKVAFADNLASNTLDRSFTYDQVGAVDASAYRKRGPRRQ